MSSDTYQKMIVGEGETVADGKTQSSSTPQKSTFSSTGSSVEKRDNERLLKGNVQWQKRTNVLQEREDWDGLLDWCLKWTKTEPDRDLGWYYLGNAYIHLDRDSDAVNSYLRALQINPEDAEYWLGLGKAYGLISEDAIDAYSEAVRINPDHVGAWQSLGLAYGIFGPYDKAINAYRQTIRIDPKNCGNWEGLSNVYMSLARYDEAIDACRKALQINSRSSYAWFNIGRSCHDLKHYNDAVDAFLQAIRINSEDASHWYDLGHAYYELKLYDQAVEAYMGSCGRTPKSDESEAFWSLTLPCFCFIFGQLS